MRHLVLIVSVLCLGFIVTSCSRGAYNQTFVNSSQMPSQSMLVAVLPFENLTTHRNAGIICSELLSTELYRKGVFRMIEQSRVRKWMTNNKINPSQLTETTYAQAVARALGVHAVIIGSVSEYGYQHGLKEEPTVGINVRLVSGGDANVLWASSSSDIGRGLFNRDSANETAQRVVVRMVHELMKCMKNCKPMMAPCPPATRPCPPAARPCPPVARSCGPVQGQMYQVPMQQMPMQQMSMYQMPAGQGNDYPAPAAYGGQYYN